MSANAGPSLKELIVGVDRAMPAPEAPGMFTIRLQGETKLVAVTELLRLRGELRGALSGGYRRIAARIAGGKAGHEEMDAIRKDQYIVSRVSDTLGGVSFPPLTIWDRPEALLNQGQVALKGNDLSSAAGTLEPADVESARADQRFIEYREGTISGASRAVTGLEVTRDVSFLTAGILATVATGGAAGAVIGAGITGVGTAAQQGMEVHLGMRDRIDWAGITFDALIGIVTAKLGGKLGNSVASGLMKNPTFAKYGGKLVATVVSDLIAGKATVILHSTARFVFDKMRGANENVTVEDFVHELAANLTDPKSLLHDLLLGELARRIHGSAGNMNRSSSSKSGSSGGESKPPKGGKGPTDPPATKAGAESRTSSAAPETQQPAPKTAPKAASAEQTTTPRSAPTEQTTTAKSTPSSETRPAEQRASTSPRATEPSAAQRRSTPSVESTPEPKARAESRPKKSSNVKNRKRDAARREHRELAEQAEADREMEPSKSRAGERTRGRQRKEDLANARMGGAAERDQANAAKGVRKILQETAGGKKSSTSVKRKEKIVIKAIEKAKLAQGQTARIKKTAAEVHEMQQMQQDRAAGLKVETPAPSTAKKTPPPKKSAGGKAKSPPKSSTPAKKTAAPKKGANAKAVSTAKKPTAAKATNKAAPKSAAPGKKSKAPTGTKGKSSRRKGAKTKRPAPENPTLDRNTMVGEVTENLFSTKRGRETGGVQKSFWRGKPLMKFELTNKTARSGTSRPDEVIVRVPKDGRAKMANVEMKGNDLREASVGQARTRAKEHLQEIQGKVENVLPGSSFEMTYAIKPPEPVRQAMLAELFKPGSPIRVVRFGGATYQNPNPP